MSAANKRGKIEYLPVGWGAGIDGYRTWHGAEKAKKTFGGEATFPSTLFPE
jgi:hypothetical protein